MPIGTLLGQSCLKLPVGCGHTCWIRHSQIAAKGIQARTTLCHLSLSSSLFAACPFKLKSSPKCKEILSIYSSALQNVNAKM